MHLTNDMDTQFLCKDCERYNLCKYYHGRKETSYICKFFHIGKKMGKWIPVNERLPEEYGEYLITWKNSKYPKPYIGICECEITDVYDHEHNRFEVEWLFDGYITTAYPDSYVIAWMPLPEPYKAERR